MTVPTTDEMDKITFEERNALVGYCKKDAEWFKFIRGVHFERCPKCKGAFSNEHGFQIISQRTFTDTKSKKKRSKTAS